MSCDVYNWLGEIARRDDLLASQSKHCIYNVRERKRVRVRVRVKERYRWLMVARYMNVILNANRRSAMFICHRLSAKLKMWRRLE